METTKLYAIQRDSWMNDTLMGIHGYVVAETQTVTRADIHKLSSREYALEQQWFSLVKKRSLL